MLFMMTREQWLASLEESVAQKSAAALAKPRKIAKLLSVVQVAGSQADLLQSQLLQRAEQAGSGVPACRAGCAYCCVIRVATTPVEVIRIAEWLAQNRTEEELAALRSQLRDYCLAVEARYFETRRPCPFLTDASFCGIYEVRPVSCRSYFSFDLSACIEHFQQNLPSRIPKLDDTLVFGQTISAGLSRATPGEPRFVDLHKSVLRALEPGARERFLAGEVIFADCAVT